MTEHRLPGARDPLLFTPGPLTTSLSVKQAMLHDAGSWHFQFNATVASIRERLLTLAGTSKDAGYETVLMQGSGTFGVESVITTAAPRDGRILVVANGAYGERAIMIATTAGIDVQPLRYPEDTPASADDVRAALRADPAITTVAVVHCETTTGLLNPIDEIGRAVKGEGRTYIVDAMSSFAGIPIDVPGIGIDFLISSANKCIEGVPGFSFVIARRDALEPARATPAATVWTCSASGAASRTTASFASRRRRTPSWRSRRRSTSSTRKVASKRAALATAAIIRRCSQACATSDSGNIFAPRCRATSSLRSTIRSTLASTSPSSTAVWQTAG